MRSTRNSIRRPLEGTKDGITFAKGPQLRMPRPLSDERPLWAPDAERVGGANLTAFIQHIQTQKPPGADAVADYATLYRWSVDRPDAFWPEVWRFCGVVADERPG